MVFLSIAILVVFCYSCFQASYNRYMHRRCIKAFNECMGQIIVLKQQDRDQTHMNKAIIAYLDHISEATGVEKPE